MSLILHIFAVATAFVTFGIALFLAIEVVAAIWPIKPLRLTRKTPETVAVVIPAHNEGKIISRTLENVRLQLRVCDRLIVVADNCIDNTAETARAKGAECIERTDPDRRGKGYALQFGINALRSAPPDIVIFIDADCVFSEGALQSLASLSFGENRPVQGLYLMNAPQGAGPRLRVAAFAWLFMNGVRMRGLQRLFNVTRFTGSGFAIPWRIAEDLNLASEEIVEDLALTFALVKKNTPPMLAPEAVIASEFPIDEEALTRQSARWSWGSLSYAVRSGASWLKTALKTGNKQLLGAVFDLFVPPLTVFGFCLAIVMALATASALLGDSVAIYLVLTAVLLTGCSVLAGWAVYGRDVLQISDTIGLARFGLSKLRVFGAAGRESAKKWTATRTSDRDDGAS